MVAQSKALMRKQMLWMRDALSEAEKKEKSAAIKEKLFALDEFKKARVIAFYISKGSEVDTFGMIADALKEGKEILVPVTNDEIEFVKFTSFDDLAPAKFNVLEPKTKIPAEKQPDIVILPGLAFDLGLHRLGYGKGYYDKILKKLPNAIRIGICFDFQIVDNIPKHEHDERLHMIISEKRIIR
jgi:5-formyltetrahydrofolate cyclo-ligase